MMLLPLGLQVYTLCHLVAGVYIQQDMFSHTFFLLFLACVGCPVWHIWGNLDLDRNRVQDR